MTDRPSVIDSGIKCMPSEEITLGLPQNSVKSSDEILTELFGTFNAKPPDSLESFDSLANKSNKHHKKNKADRHLSHKHKRKPKSKKSKRHKRMSVVGPKTRRPRPNDIADNYDSRPTNANSEETSFDKNSKPSCVEDVCVSIPILNQEESPKNSYSEIEVIQREMGLGIDLEVNSCRPTPSNSQHRLSINTSADTTVVHIITDKNADVGLQANEILVTSRPTKESSNNTRSTMLVENKKNTSSVGLELINLEERKELSLPQSVTGIANTEVVTLPVISCEGLAGLQTEKKEQTPSTEGISEMVKQQMSKSASRERSRSPVKKRKRSKECSPEQGGHKRSSKKLRHRNRSKSQDIDHHHTKNGKGNKAKSDNHGNRKKRSKSRDFDHESKDRKRRSRSVEKSAHCSDHKKNRSCSRDRKAHAGDKKRRSKSCDERIHHEINHNKGREGSGYHRDKGKRSRSRDRDRRKRSISRERSSDRKNTKKRKGRSASKDKKTQRKSRDRSRSRNRKHSTSVDRGTDRKQKRTSRNRSAENKIENANRERSTSRSKSQAAESHVQNPIEETTITEAETPSRVKEIRSRSKDIDIPTRDQSISPSIDQVEQQGESHNQVSLQIDSKDPLNKDLDSYQSKRKEQSNNHDEDTRKIDKKKSHRNSRKSRSKSPIKDVHQRDRKRKSKSTDSYSHHNRSRKKSRSKSPIKDVHQRDGKRRSKSTDSYSHHSRPKRKSRSKSPIKDGHQRDGKRRSKSTDSYSHHSRPKRKSRSRSHNKDGNKADKRRRSKSKDGDIKRSDRKSRSESRSRHKSNRIKKGKSKDREDHSKNKTRSKSKDAEGRNTNRKSRSKSRDKDKSSHRTDKRSRSKSPDRSRRNIRKKRSRSREVRIDKRKLFEIARKNAMSMLKQAAAPFGTENLVTIKAGGKSVEELTDFCKQLSKKEAGISSDSDGDETHHSDSDVERPFHHPFQLKERPTNIVLNIRNSVSVPTKTFQEKTAEQSKQLRLQFPVSSGQNHRKTESEWVPVASGQPSSSVQPSSSASQPCQTVGQTLIQPVSTAVSTAVPSTVLAAVQADSQSSSSVFPPAPASPPDIGNIVEKRVNAMRKLTANPNDSHAISQIYQVNQQMSMWLASKQQPGQFTGSTGAKVLTAAQLSTGYQAWAKKDQLMTAAPVSGGMGMALLQKMGWRPGEGLGKNKEGSLEPLTLEVKMDKKGLVAQEELSKKHQSSGRLNQKTTTLAGKHPVSLLVEFCSKRHWDSPQFHVCFECGPDHKKNFLFKVRVNGIEYQPSVASNNKKQAKAEAARLCLQTLGLLYPDAPK